MSPLSERESYLFPFVVCGVISYYTIDGRDKKMEYKHSISLLKSLTTVSTFRMHHKWQLEQVLYDGNVCSDEKCRREVFLRFAASEMLVRHANILEESERTHLSHVAKAEHTSEQDDAKVMDIVERLVVSGRIEKRRKID